MSMWIAISFFGEGKRILGLFLAIIRSRIKQEKKAGYYKRILKYRAFQLKCTMLYGFLSD